MSDAIHSRILESADFHCEGTRMTEEAFRLKVTLHEGEVHIHGNRAGLRDLANTCAALVALSDEEAKTAANHVVYADYMNSADDESIPLMVCLQLEP
jgi:hypothetical protein